METNLDGMSVVDFAREALKLGFTREIRVYLELSFHMQDGTKGTVFREWIGKATAMSLVGDFNDWDANSHPAHRLEHDVFEVWLPDKGDEQAIPHLSKVKVLLTLREGTRVYRVPSHIHYAIPDPINTSSYVGVYWDFENHDYAYAMPTRQSPLLLDHSGLRFTLSYSLTHSIYECHIGMSGEEPAVSTYTSFLLSVLPRIVADGYNCVDTACWCKTQVQIMAVVEHAYYASFGYHCNMFYAVSSRFGTPVDFKAGFCVSAHV